MRWVNWVIVTIAVTVWLAAIFAWAPRIESAWFPPLERRIINTHQTPDLLTLWFSGIKNRDCLLTAVSATWVYPNGLAMPTALVRDDGTIVGAQVTTNFRAGDRFISGPFTVRITQAVAAEPQIRLRVVNTYRCRFPWDVYVQTWLPLADVPTTPPVP